jgi:DNA-directed RNA polymerase subunit RPC12/RpoP
MPTLTPTPIKTSGLTCPKCSQALRVAEGERIVRCPNCDTRSLVQGECDVRRWQVLCDVDRSEAIAAVQKFWQGITKANDLKRVAQIEETLLIYLPYWHATAFVSGWTFGRKKLGKNSSKPVEVHLEKELFWNDAAVDVSEFGVHRVPLITSNFTPYDSERLHAEGLVFEPTESPTDALKEAQEIFQSQATPKNLKFRYATKLHTIRKRLSLVYYPLWLTRYSYNGRRYQVMVDGKGGGILYGKAPGNLLFRSTMLVIGLALGNFLLANMTVAIYYILTEAIFEGGRGVLFFMFIPLIIGLTLIVVAYNSFRYGEEVTQQGKDVQKERPRKQLRKNDEDILKIRDTMLSPLNLLED